MKHIKKFNETKKTEKVEKVKDQEVLFNSEVLVDKDEKPSFKTEVEDQEKVKKEFDKLRKVKKFENFTIEIEVGVKPEGEEECEEETQEVGCGCCDQCNGQLDCACCQDCSCGQSQEEEPMGEQPMDQSTEGQPMGEQPRVMNIADFIKSIVSQ